ncbi:MAG TPA: GNAT family N-acetyltransferase [Phenylobacterium sp.]|nr:GNAT family N-acetyltransferase [Phenylobacterium sp.]
MSIEICEVDLAHVDRAAWDSFAIQCDVSARGMWQRLTAWQVKHLFHYRVRLFELFTETGGQRRKVGQCAVAVSRDGRCLFLPRLQLAAAGPARWRAAMQALLPAIGAQVYKYGWELSLEPPREAELAAMPGVEILSARPITVHAVDFSRWRSWDDYYRQISENSRRNAKAAERRFPDLEVRVRAGRASLQMLPALVRLKDHQRRRKGLNLSTASLAVTYAVSALFEPEHVLSAGVWGGGRMLSTCFGWEVGDNFWYLDAASAPDNGGAAWTLLLAMLKRAYERCPTGKFIMGYVDYAIHDEAQGGGLLRSRQACRVQDYPTSILTFRHTAV